MKIAWLSMSQAPYREPMWRELAALADLKVSFLFHEDKLRHWVWRADADYRSSVVPIRRIPLPRSILRLLDNQSMALLPGDATRELLDGADALVIQEWSQLAFTWCALRARLKGIPYIIYTESTLCSRRFSRGLPARCRSFAFKHASAVVVPSPAARDAAHATGTPAERIVETVNSVDLGQFESQVRALRRDHHHAPPHRFVYVGQLIARKNVDSLIRALATHGGDATLDIAGDGVELEGLRALAVARGVADRVRFRGFLPEPDVVALLAEAHTLVLPSTEEVYGFTALEGHVAGLHTIVSDAAGIAGSLAGRPGTWVVAPTEQGLCAALRESEAQWSGWREVNTEDFASPRRAAADIVRAVQVAHRSLGRRERPVTAAG